GCDARRHRGEVPPVRALSCGHSSIHVGPDSARLSSYERLDAGGMTAMRCLRLLQLGIVGCAVLTMLMAAHAQPPAKLRDAAAATVDNPLTRPEVEALLQKFRGQSLTFASWGGALQAAQRQAYLEPFEKQFGVKFVEDTNPLQPKIQAMVEAKNVTIDLVDLGLRQSSDLATRNALEALDFRVVDRRRTPEIWRSEWSGGGGAVWATVLAYRDGVRKPTS